MNKVVEQYLEFFKEIPCRPFGVSFNNEEYQELLKAAIKRGTPLTEDEVFSKFNGKYDIIKK